MRACLFVTSIPHYLKINTAAHQPGPAAQARRGSGQAIHSTLTLLASFPHEHTASTPLTAASIHQRKHSTLALLTVVSVAPSRRTTFHTIEQHSTVRTDRPQGRSIHQRKHSTLALLTALQLSPPAGIPPNHTRNHHHIRHQPTSIPCHRSIGYTLSSSPLPTAKLSISTPRSDSPLHCTGTCTCSIHRSPSFRSWPLLTDSQHPAQTNYKNFRTDSLHIRCACLPLLLRPRHSSE